MSTQTIETAVEKKPAEALFSKRRKKFVNYTLSDENQITINVF